MLSTLERGVISKEEQIETLTKESGVTKSGTANYNNNACYELATLSLGAQCDFGMSPQACTELKKIKKAYKK